MVSTEHQPEIFTKHVAALRTADQIVRLLVEDGLEYSDPSKYFEYRSCHFCNRADYEGHADTCQWGRLLKEWRELQLPVLPDE